LVPATDLKREIGKLHSQGLFYGIVKYRITRRVCEVGHQNGVFFSELGLAMKIIDGRRGDNDCCRQSEDRASPKDFAEARRSGWQSGLRNCGDITSSTDFRVVLDRGVN